MGNKIRFQDLTPEVYYKQSRDFQFIGRLFDIVLNSVKTNADQLYNLPLGINSDEQLIDLMALTLGFKSKHNYNIKQLKSLCSAFATVMRNKGNINSILLAARAVLNAEGIDEDIGYSFGDITTGYIDNTVLNILLPQNLTDINLFKDLLNYILPAGMSCNIIREFQVNDSRSTTELTSSDSITKYEKVNINAKSIVPKAEQTGLTDATAKDTAGLIANTEVYKPDKTIEE